MGVQLHQTCTYPVKVCVVMARAGGALEKKRCHSYSISHLITPDYHTFSPSPEGGKENRNEPCIIMANQYCRVLAPKRPVIHCCYAKESRRSAPAVACHPGGRRSRRCHASIPCVISCRRYHIGSVGRRDDQLSRSGWPLYKEGARLVYYSAAEPS